DRDRVHPDAFFIGCMGVHLNGWIRADAAPHSNAASVTGGTMRMQGKRHDGAKPCAWRASAPVPSPPGRRPRLLLWMGKWRRAPPGGALPHPGRAMTF